MSKFEVEPVVNFQIGLQTVSFVSVHSPPGWCTLRSESVLVSGKDTCVLMIEHFCTACMANSLGTYKCLFITIPHCIL